MKRLLDQSLHDTAVLFGGLQGYQRVPGSDSSADEKRAMCFFDRDFANVSAAASAAQGGGDARLAAVAVASSAAEAVALLRQHKQQRRDNEGDDESPVDVQETADEFGSSAAVASLPGGQGSSGNLSAAEARLQSARERLAPIDSTSAMVLHTKTVNAAAREQARPQWHAPWKLMRVVSGHNGWVRSIAVDVSNEWFATGSNDRTIKIWDLASGTLKLTLTGHISSVRGLQVSARHPYLFSVGEDKTVKCWDLEQNKVVRTYHGHLSGIYACALHPQLDVLFTAGRDAVIRVWDMRTRQQIMCLEGHSSAVWDIKTQKVDPQVITGAGDAQVRLWDLAAGKCSAVLTNHKKGVRALALSSTDFSFVSGSPDNIKKWKLPEGRFIENFAGHEAIINSLALNEDGVCVSAADNGTIKFWDYKTGYNFQSVLTKVQPGSLAEAEAGIFASAFDQSGSRYITCEADKTIKFWKEDESATPESHPVEWNADDAKKRW